MVDLGELAKFLAFVRKIRGGQYTLKDGYYVIERDDGDWGHTDRFRGTINPRDNYDGKKIVTFRGTPVWQMNYEGQALHDGDYEFTMDLNYFHERALNLSPDMAPFRGPSNFTRDDYRYETKCLGDLRCFTGREKITYRSQIVLKGTYHGALLVPSK